MSFRGPRSGPTPAPPERAPGPCAAHRRCGAGGNHRCDTEVVALPGNERALARRRGTCRIWGLWRLLAVTRLRGNVRSLRSGIAALPHAAAPPYCAGRNVVRVPFWEPPGARRLGGRRGGVAGSRHPRGGRVGPRATLRCPRVPACGPGLRYGCGTIIDGARIGGAE
jgi:DNA-binding transcriptional LysR family regulator